MKGRKPNLVAIDGGRGRCPPPPHWMSEQAKVEWRRVAPKVHGRGQLTGDMKAMVEAYCVAFGTVRECEEQMQADGRFADGAPHAAFKMQMAAMREVRLLAAELRITRQGAGKAARGEERDGDSYAALGI